MKLTRVAPATDKSHTIYNYVDNLGGGWMIICRTGRSWNARLGSHATTEWVAIHRTENDASGLPLLAASGVTLSSLKKRFQSYLNDRSAGCVRHKSHYGVM